MFRNIEMEERLAADRRREAMREAELDRLIHEIEGPRRRPRWPTLLAVLGLVAAVLVVMAQFV